MADQWYYAVGNEKTGPFPESKIKELILNSQLKLNDLVWKKGMTNWDKIENMPEFVSKDQDCPPPLPINQVLPSTNEGLVVSNKVTVEVNIGKNSFAHDSYHIHIFVDEEFVGGSASLKDGVHGDSFQTSLGLHSIKLAVISSKNEILRYKMYNIMFENGGHHILDFKDLPDSMAKEKPVGFFSGVMKGLAKAFGDFPESFLINRVGEAKEKLEPSLYFKKMILGLWEDTNNVGSSIMFTNDGALIRNDGLMAKYQWIEKYKLQVNDLHKKDSFIIDVISVNKFQMILSLEGQNLVLKKGKSLTEIEIENEKELMLKQAHLKSQAFKNNAIGVGTMLMGGGLAVLSAGVGIGAAVAGAASSSSSSSKDPNKGLKEPDNRQNDPNRGMKRCQSCGGQGFKYSGNGNSTVCGYCGGKGWGY